MSNSTVPDWYRSAEARGWTVDPLDRISPFHASLPGYAPSPLVELPELAAELGVGRVLLKDESARLGLPAFKILGASYAVSRALSARFGAPARALPLDELRAFAAARGRPVLIAATDGNHGRAVAHMARLLGLPARIFFPAAVTPAAKDAVAAEGASVVELELEYDAVVEEAARAAAAAGEDAVLIQDTAWPGYEEVPRWIVDGYATLFEEIDEQLASLGVRGAELVAVPVGVGSLAQAAVRHFRSADRQRPVSVLSVEAERAPAIIASLHAGRSVAVDTADTIMAGLNCGTVSANAWPVLRDGLDAAITVGDPEAARAVHDLARLGVDSGPCGAATLAGVRRALGDRVRRAELGIGAESVVVLLSTEGRSANPLPQEYER